MSPNAYQLLTCHPSQMFPESLGDGLLKILLQNYSEHMSEFPKLLICYLKIDLNFKRSPLKPSNIKTFF